MYKHNCDETYLIVYFMRFNKPTYKRTYHKPTILMGFNGVIILIMGLLYYYGYHYGLISNSSDNLQ